MEEIQTAPNRPRARRVVTVAALAAFIVTCGVIACGRALKGYSLNDSLDPSMPVLDLHVAYFDPSGNPLGEPVAGTASPVTPVGAVESASGSSSSEEAAGETGDTSSNDKATQCSEIVGGDFGAHKPAALRRHYWEPTPVPCPLSARWNVYRHPVALSLYAKKGADIGAWYERNAAVASFRDSTVWKGLVQQVSVMLRVRAEDLELSDWKGEFLKPLATEALSAHAALHYDVIHGGGGFVFTFVRDEAPLLGKALPVLVRATATNAYRIPGFEQAVAELRLQGMHVFLTQVAERVYIGTSLEGLLNVLAEKPAEGPDLDGSLVVVVRAETYLHKLLPVAVGHSVWPLAVSFDLSETHSALAQAYVPKAKFFGSFAAKPALGVLAAVPRDVLAALVLSAHVPLDKTVKEWSIPSQAPTEPSGLSLVWDVSGKDGVFNVGIAVPMLKAAAEGEDAPGPADFLSDYAVSDTCAGGAIWLGASSDALLARMRESCEKQTSSLLDIKGENTPALPDQQVALFFNAKVWLTEFYRLGGGETPPTDAHKGEVEAQKRLAKEVFETAKQLPVLGLAGRLVAPSQDLKLAGFTAPNPGA